MSKKINVVKFCDMLPQSYYYNLQNSISKIKTGLFCLVLISLIADEIRNCWATRKRTFYLNKYVLIFRGFMTLPDSGRITPEPG